jgi:hypothetical protein
MCEHNGCIFSQNSVLFITVPQNSVAVKVEVDDVIEENSIDVKSEEIYIPSACSRMEVEPEVSCAFR